jgi:hypothetical protein
MLQADNELPGAHISHDFRQASTNRCWRDPAKKVFRPFAVGENLDGCFDTITPILVGGVVDKGL